MTKGIHSVVTLALILFIGCGALTGCAPGLRESISVAEVTLPQRMSTTKVPLKVRLIRTEDRRPVTAVVQINGRNVAAQEDVAEVVQQALESYLRSEGVQPVLFDAPAILDAEVSEWQAEVRPAFPATLLQAKAVVRLNLRDGRDALKYRGSYSGETSTKHPFTSEAVVSRALGEAMAAALSEAVRDERLLAALERLQ